MLTDTDRRAAQLLAQMQDVERGNAARLGFVTLSIQMKPPSFVSETVDISPEILAEEARIRSLQAQTVR
jgi:hypothetical protein